MESSIVSVHRCCVIFVVRGVGENVILTYWNYFTTSLKQPLLATQDSVVKAALRKENYTLRNHFL